MRSQHPTDVLERENEALRRFLDEKDRAQAKEKKMPTKPLLRWETLELLRAFKRLHDNVPDAARPYIARFLYGWKRDFGRKDVKAMLLRWARIDDLIGAWQLVVPREED